MNKFSLNSSIKGIIFDVDGTLYNQNLLRRFILRKITINLLKYPVKTIYEIRIIYLFRKIRENLRYNPSPGLLKDLQYDIVAKKLKVSRKVVEDAVGRWIYTNPLVYLHRCKSKGLDEFLSLCAQKGIKLGIFSDYPSKEKLKAMGINGYFKAEISAIDLEVNSFKPSPIGLEVTLKKLGLLPEHSIYVGDRDIDEIAARKAGMGFLKIGQKSGDIRSYGEIFFYC